MPSPSLAELGDDLAALVAEAGVALCEVTPLSVRGKRGVASVFRLRFADGRVCKGSRIGNAGQVARVASLVAALGDGAPRLLACRGKALLSEWVDGATLAAADYDAVRVRACGAWQARVHRGRPLDAAAAGACLAQRRERLQQQLGRLRAGGSLDEGEVAALERLAAVHAPASCEAGVSLSDFCPENIVWRPSGEPCLIDVETLNHEPHDYDLARTWYRWPMSAAQRGDFFAGYRQHRDPASFFAHRPFWLLAAVASSAIFRRDHRADAIGVPLAVLRALARRPDGDPMATAAH